MIYNIIESSPNFQVGLVQSLGKDLEDETFEIYSTIFQKIEKTHPFLIKCHNFIPDILSLESEIVRYHSFNQGRNQAFQKFGYYRKPSACALGTPDSRGLQVWFVASNTPPIEIENPNQVSSYNYPKQYGSPLFSRSVIHQNEQYISGTASIVGSQTVYPENIVLQYEQTLTNIRSLIKNRELTDFTFITYVKHQKDVDIIKTISPVSSTYVVCDICRDDLLVEVEASTHNAKQFTPFYCT